MYIIGIAGGTGSGKTTVVKKIMKALEGENVAVIPQDSYYNDNTHLTMEERRKINYDHPDAFDWNLLCQQLHELRQGKAIEQPTYDYITSNRMKETIHVEPCDSAQSQAINLFVDRQILLYIGIRRRNICFGLVVVVVRHKILHRIMWKELPHLAIQLCGQGLVVA